MPLVPVPFVTLKRRPEPNNAVSLDCFEFVESEQRATSITPLFNLDGASRERAFYVKEETVTDETTGKQQRVVRVEPDLPADTILVEVLYLSVDPYLRCQFNEDTGVDYAHPFAIGQPLYSAGVAVVHVSTDPKAYPVGCLVTSMTLMWAKYNVICLDDLRKMNAALITLPQRIPPTLPREMASMALGVLGITGLTAYFGLVKKAKIEPGKSNVLVTTAAGATGTAACQIARLLGAKRVVGLTSSQAKMDVLVKELGASAAVNYRKATSGDAKQTEEFVAELMAATEGEGFDVYFDNVGGLLTDVVVTSRCLLQPKARIVLCGQISAYDTDAEYPPPIPDLTKKTLQELEIERDRYTVVNYGAEFGEALQQLTAWVLGGQLLSKETTYSGLSATPAAFVKMMSGDNIGKAVVRL